MCAVFSDSTYCIRSPACAFLLAFTVHPALCDSLFVWPVWLLALFSSACLSNKVFSIGMCASSYGQICPIFFTSESTGLSSGSPTAFHKKAGNYHAPSIFMPVFLLFFFLSKQKTCPLFAHFFFHESLFFFWARMYYVMKSHLLLKKVHTKTGTSPYLCISFTLRYSCQHDLFRLKRWAFSPLSSVRVPVCPSVWERFQRMQVLRSTTGRPSQEPWQ